MKRNRLFNRIITIITVLILTMSFSGCNWDFFDDTGSQNPGGKSEYYQDASNGILAEVALKNSLTETEDFTIVSSRGQSATQMSYEDAVQSVERAVVSIVIEDKVNNVASAGSGVILNLVNKTLTHTDFVVLTCHHVINRPGADVTIYVPDGHGRNFNDAGYDEINYVFTGKIGGSIDLTQQVALIGGDQASDIAVLRLRVNSLVAPNIAMAKVTQQGIDAVRKGSQIFTIGNSLGDLPGRVSTGTISYVNRAVSVNPVGDMVLLGIDANSYHGNSGGGLFNMYGELIGITNCGDDTNLGINYAIPASNSSNKTTDTGFVNIANQLISTATTSNYGYVSGRNGKFGFTIMNTENGVEVVEMNNLQGYAPAYQAGMRVGDVITGVVINGVTYEIEKVLDYTTAVKNLVINEEYTIIVSTVYGSREIKLTPRQIIFCNTQNYTGMTA